VTGVQTVCSSDLSAMAVIASASRLVRPILKV